MMLLKQPQASRILLIRPGATDFDEQGRIKGSLDMPLSNNGREQAAALAQELLGVRVKTIFTAPSESARETAEQLAQGRDVRIKVIECFRNIDHGLWHGKLIEEVRRNQPKVYRRGQDTPDDVCPPGGEPIRDAKARVLKGLRKVVRKGREDVVALVVPDPLATVVQSMLSGEDLRDLWKAETDAGQWRLIESMMS